MRSTLACRLAHEGWAACSLPASRAFRRALADPEASQRWILERLLRRNATTAYGRRHGFASLRGVEAYRERVPIVDYDDLAPWIERIRRGERGVLTAEPVRRLVPSSGSSAARKLIPWTGSVAAEWSRAVRPWTHDLLTRHPEVKGGPAYWSVSPALGEVTGNGPGGAAAMVPGGPSPGAEVPIGFDEDSAYLGGLLRPLVRATLAVPEAIRRVRDPERFRHLTALALLGTAELRMVSVWHPSFFGILLDTVEERWDLLLRDVACGTAPTAGLRLRPDPARARALERVRPTDVRAIWPRLALVSCWADGPSAGAADALRQRLAGVALQPKGLVATEGAVTVPFAGERPVAIRSHFLEFLDGAGRARGVGELEDGGAYGVLLTTGGGLYRYRLGDRVRVEGFLERTPCLRFVGREDDVSDLCGEKLHGAFVAGALERLFGPERPAFAMLAPDPGRGGAGYTLYVESAVPRCDDLVERLDAALSENPHYRSARRLGQLRAPAVYEVEGDAHRVYIAHEAAEGRRIGDVKPVALSRRAGWSERFRGAYAYGATAGERWRRGPAAP